MVLDDGPRYADRISLVSSNPPYLEEQFLFAAEAPGAIISYRQGNFGFAPEPAINAYWQDVPGGYRVEAEIPLDLLGTNLGFIISNTGSANERGTRSRNYSGQSPAPLVIPSVELRLAASKLAQSGMRILITDTAGWRIAAAGELSAATTDKSLSDGWSRRIYDLLVEGGEDTTSAEPDPGGREQHPYVSAALNGKESASWFRGEDSGRAIVAVAAPIENDGDEGLARLINITLLATFLVAAGLIGYASWLSRRVLQLSLAAEDALENETLQSALPSALAKDEIGATAR
jgi:hypothetical protein